MCLGIPGQVVEILDEDIYLAKAEVGGVRRNINIGLVHHDEERIEIGDWVLIHVGFAMSKLDEDEAHSALTGAGADRGGVRAGVGGAQSLPNRMNVGEKDLMLSGSCTLDHDGCITCSDAGIPLRIISVQGDDALCEDAAGNRTQIAVELVAPVQGGEVLLTHGGVAIGRVFKEVGQ